MPRDLDSRVVEFAALTNEALRDAIEPQLYGLMGASPKERAWGDYEEELEFDVDDDYGYVGTHTTVRHRTQPSYEKAHGARLQGMRKFLEDNKGAVVVCEDPIGIAQELGHLQIEAQVFYTHWQLEQAEGFADKVSNEWVFQSAMGVQGLEELIKKNAIARTSKRIERWNKMLDDRDKSFQQIGRTPEEKAEIARRNAELRARAEANQRAEMEAAKKAGEEDFKKYYDEDAAKTIFDRQKDTYEKLQTRLEALGRDQVAWLQSDALLTVMGRYSDKDDRIDRCGGGASLSLQLGQCLAGPENNRAGQAYLLEQELLGNNPLGRLLSFNSTTIKATQERIEAAKLPPYDPKAEPTTALADKVAELLKGFGAYTALIDKALTAIDKAAASESQTVKSLSERLRVKAWGSHVANALGITLLRQLKGLPASELEARLVRRVALTGLTTLGRNAQAHAQGLAKGQRTKIGNVAKKMAKLAEKGSQAAAHANAGGLRVGAMGVVLDLSFAVIKGYQVQANATARGATELVGNILQATASVADYRASAYEATVYERMKSAKLYTEKASKRALSSVNAMQLRALRMTAFRFALPAAVISAYWDVMDAIKSGKRGAVGLSIAQAAGAVGTLFAVLGAGAGLYALSTTGAVAAFWGAVGTVLGIVGAVIAVGAIIVIWALKDEEWRDWLRDNPLNKERKGQSPIHDDLQETLQKLANVREELQGA